MTYKCSCKRDGTILYRFGGDIFRALSTSLVNARKKNSGDTLSEVCLTLNAKCHANIKKFIQNDAEAPHSIENFDVSRLINDLDPDIWRTASLLINR